MIGQIDWYLAHTESEQFPGAFELAAGNLSRQLLEQVLFILCFYGGVPKRSFLRSDMSLRTAGQLLRALGQPSPSQGMSYWDAARRRGPRIRKFARYPRTLKKWQRLLNEPSHYSAGFRKISVATIQTFLVQLRSWFDEKDKHLTTCAINELYSRGRIRAILSDDEENTPGVSLKVIVTAANLRRNDQGQLSLLSPSGSMYVASDSEVPRGPWPGNLLLVQGYHGFVIQQQFVTRRGEPVDLSDFKSILKSLAKTRGQRSYLTRQLRELGFTIHYQ
jgi:hypothetical protein